MPNYAPDVVVEPEIEVHSTTSSESVILTYGECKYIFPTYVEGYGGWCGSNCFSNPTDICYDSGIERNSWRTKECLCAKQVTVCSTVFKIHGMELGCVALMPLPMPPPFFDTLPYPPRVNVVPVQSSTYTEPKLRIVVSTLTSTMVYNVDYPKNAVSDMREVVLVSEKSSNNPITVLRRLTQGEVCAKVIHAFGSDLDGSREVCFSRYGSFNYEGVKLCSEGLCIDGQTVPSFRPALFVKGGRHRCLGPLCRKGFFIGGYVCVKTDSKDSNAPDKKDICPGRSLGTTPEGELLCQDGSKDVCPTGYSAKLAYVEDQMSNMICVKDAIFRPEEYVGVFGEKMLLFKAAVRKFVPFRMERGKRVQESGAFLDIPHTEQSILDELSFDSPNRVYYLKVKGRNRAYTYEKPQVYCYNGDLDGEGGCSRPFYSVTELNTIPYASTTFTNSEGKAFFLPEDIGSKKYSVDQCEDGLCYVIAPPIYNGLCFFEEQHQTRYDYSWLKLDSIKGAPSDAMSYAYIQLPKMAYPSINFEEIDGCDMVEITALGGGSKGFWKVAGNSGEYTSVLIGSEDSRQIFGTNKLILPVVGLGGGTVVKRFSGGDSILYVCDKYNQECILDDDPNQNLNGCDYISSTSIIAEIKAFNSKKGKVNKNERARQVDKNERARQANKNERARLIMKRDKLVNHRLKFIKDRCKMVIAAKGGKVQGEEIDKSPSFGKQFEKYFTYKFHMDSIPPKEGTCGSASTPYFDLATKHPAYGVNGDCLKNLAGRSYSEKDNKNSHGEAYGRGGCPSEPCDIGEIRRGGGEAKGSAGLIRFQCQKLMISDAGNSGDSSIDAKRRGGERRVRPKLPRAF